MAASSSPPIATRSSPRASSRCSSACSAATRRRRILDTDLYFIEKIGLRQHLSPTRSNGLLSMVKQIKSYAIAYKAKEEMG